jgi:hypothetical protein
LQKSGSTLIANLEEDILLASGKRCGQSQVRKKFNGRYIQKLNLKITLQLILYNLIYGSFVIKTHTKPDRYVRFLVNLGFAKATYSYRDPRDVMLSAVDHGNRSRAGLDPRQSFLNFKSIENAIPLTIELMKICHRWHRFGKAFFIRYEDFMENPALSMEEVFKYLKIHVGSGTIREIAAKHEKNKQNSHNFNKGITYRYKTELTEEQLKESTQAFSKYLKLLKYPSEI